MAKEAIKKNKCETRYCRSKTNGTSKKCPKCCKRRQKNNDPEAYTYNALKNNAKRRGKVFTITLEYFRKFCAESNYIELKGIHKENATIDRINNELGYIEGNLRVITNAANNHKRNHVDYKGIGTKPIDFYAANRDLPPDDPNFIPY